MNMEWETKAWGSVQHVLLTDACSISHLQVVAGTRCSIHHHAQRSNLFVMIEGKLLVEEFDPTGKLSRVVPLDVGESHWVPSGIVHRFRVHESGRVVEVYWPDRGGKCELSDIHRQDEGGPDPMAMDGRLWIDARRSWTHRPNRNADMLRTMGMLPVPDDDGRDLQRRIRDSEGGIRGYG